MSLLPPADGYADTTSCLPQTSSTSGAADATLETNPSEEALPLSTAPPADGERVTTGPWAFGSPAWCFFGVPGGSSNIQRELVVTCTLCGAKVRRGINPGKVGTTCLLTHLERRHGMTRQEVYEKALASGYCGPNTMSSDCGGVGGSVPPRAATKRHGATMTSSEDDDDDEEEEKSKRQAMTAPATSSGPSTTAGPQSDRQSGSGSSAFHQALRDRLLGSVHMFCEVCHTLVLSGERSQSGRDLALETHFSTNHPQMFKLLKSGAARDVRLGGLGPLSALPSGSLPPSSQR